MFMLVMLGAAMVMMTSEYMQITFQTGDPARLGAQVISGFGFLGAGTIIVEGKTKIRGLITAAGLWAAACIGLAISIGFYFGAIVATLVVYLVIARLKSVAEHIAHKDKIERIYIEFGSMQDLEELNAAIECFGLEVLDVMVNSPADLGLYNVIFSVHNPQDHTHARILEFLQSSHGVHKVKIVY